MPATLAINCASTGGLERSLSQAVPLQQCSMPRRRMLRAAGFPWAASRRGGTTCRTSAQLVDPASSGKRLVVTPQQLKDVRQAEAYGPRGLLLIGVNDKDFLAVQRWFNAMDSEFVVSCCPPALLSSGTLREAISGTYGMAGALPEQPWQPQPDDAPPVAVFSGTSGEEVVALVEAWEENTGLQAPAFASVTPGIVDEQLRTLLADIVRAQTKQPPPGFDPEQLSAVQVAASSGAAASGGEGGEQALRNKLQDYVMLNDGQQQAAPMSLDALKDQIQDKMRQKKAQAAAAERQARKKANQDETDQLRQALRGGKKQQGGTKKGGDSGPKKGFGS